MPQRFSLFAGALIICALSYCTSNKTGNAPDFKQTSFGNTYKCSNPQVYKNDSLLLVSPRWLRFHPDSFLVIQEMGTPFLLKIIDLKTNKVQQAAPKGSGDGTVTVAWGIGILNNRIWVFDGVQKKIVFLSEDKDRMFSITREVRLAEKNVMEAFPVTDSLILGMGGSDSKNRLMVFNGSGALDKSMGDFPAIVDSKGIEPSNVIFSSFTAATPSGDKVVLACTKVDVIEIYDPRSGLIKRMHGPEGVSVRVKKKQVLMGTMLTTEPAMSAYWNVVGKQDQFWAGYSGFLGEKGKRPKDTDIYPREIYCFGWDGSPRSKLQFDIPLSSFDIDENSGKIYCLTKNPKDEIDIFDYKK